VSRRSIPPDVRAMALADRRQGWAAVHNVQAVVKFPTATRTDPASDNTRLLERLLRTVVPRPAFVGELSGEAHATAGIQLLLRGAIQ
jgi:hypothetical protein